MDESGTILERSSGPALNQGSGQNSDPAPHPLSPWRRRVTLGSSAVALIAAVAILPPLINVGRYQRQVTSLVSRSLGRPVQLSKVSLKILPRPGFVLHDLSVAEDPNFGTEPVLTARTVVASIAVASLWKGSLAIDRVSVDEASLNLVQTSQGRWNLQALMTGAQPSPAKNSDQAPTSSSNVGKAAVFPYLEATNSRVNLKRGFEKSPFSVVNTDLSLWQDNPGQWRVRLRGQPVRTDIEMSWADTGQVRLEASLQSAPELKDMPLKLQMEWRDAQLGQLSRLMLGSDAGWRGDLTADIDVQGTADSAQTKARLRATGVRREEFAPETPLDFDANCNFRYQHSSDAFHDVACDTALGAGHLLLTADLPGTTGAPSAMLQVKQVPLQAALDLLRTVQGGIAPGITAKGMANGSLTYKPSNEAVERTSTPSSTLPAPSRSMRSTERSNSRNTLKVPDNVPGEQSGNLQGALTVEGGQLKGGGLKEPLLLPTLTWKPAVARQPSPSATQSIADLGLETRFSLAFAPPALAKTPPPVTPAEPKPEPSGSITPKPTKTPLPDAATARSSSSGDATVEPSASANSAGPAAVASTAQSIEIRVAVAASGYAVTVNGAAPIAKLRDLAYALGLPQNDNLDSLSGGAPQLNVSAKGPWIETADIGSQAASSEQTGSRLSNPAGGIKSPDDVAVRTTTKTTAKPLPTAKQTTAVNSLPDVFSPAPTPAVWGTLQLHRAQWKPAYLPRPAELQQMIVSLSGQSVTLTSDFSYGSSATASPKAVPEPKITKSDDSAATNVTATDPAEENTSKQAPAAASSIPATPRSIINGSATITGSLTCPAPHCESVVQLKFGALDASVIQAALLSTPQSQTGISPLIDRVRNTLRPTGKPAYPQLKFSLVADSLFLGAATLQKPVIHAHFDSAGKMVIDSWEINVLSGTASGTGNLSLSADAPAYEFEGTFSNLNPALTGALVGNHWSASSTRQASPVTPGSTGPKGNGLSGSGKIKLSGLVWKQIADSASGEIHFTWPGGTVAPVSSQSLRFESWSGVFTLGGGKAQLGKNTMTAGKRSTVLAGQIPLGGVAKFSIDNTSPQVAGTNAASSVTASQGGGTH